MSLVRLFLLMVALVFAQNAFAYTALDGGGPKISQLAESLLKSRKYAELDKLADEYRTGHIKVTGGNSALYHFYPGVGGAHSKDIFAGSINAEQRLALLTEWLEKRPSSKTARIATAVFWNVKGWEARGGGYANTVSDSQWTVLRECFKKARGYLGGVVEKSDPEINYLLIDMALAESATRAEIELLYRKATETNPDFYHYYVQHSVALQEKWQGGPGEFRFYVNSLLEEPGGDDGRIAYSYLAAHFALTSGSEINEIFQSVGFRWASVRDGFRLRKEKYELRNRDWNVYALLAGIGGSPADARDALNMVGDAWDPMVWHSRQGFLDFVDYVDIALDQKKTIYK